MRISTSTSLRVAPLAGAWIEMPSIIFDVYSGPVAPLAGAWIEIECLERSISWDGMSHPSRVRGLKYGLRFRRRFRRRVAPLAGAWIEISGYEGKLDGAIGRTPRGCVD